MNTAKRSILALAGTLVLALAACSSDPSPADPMASHSPSGGPAVSANLASQLAAARLATAKYASDLALAQKDGYMIITPMMPEMGFHYLNPRIEGFDVTKPAILVYQKTGTTWQLGALEWVFPKQPDTPPLEGATYGSFPAACHFVDGSFVPTKTEAECAKTSAAGSAFGFWHPDLTTLHVWLWYHNPAGLYNGTNPLVSAYTG